MLFRSQPASTALGDEVEARDSVGEVPELDSGGLVSSSSWNVLGMAGGMFSVNEKFWPFTGNVSVS